MNTIRLLRTIAGITQKELAQRGKTSQPAIALYESGAKSPTISTVERLAESVGLHAMVSFGPKMSREDFRSLAYHRAVVEKIRKDPSQVLMRAKRSLLRMIDRHPNAHTHFKKWRSWLEFPCDELISKMLDSGQEARDMRSVSPFSGILAPKERARILNNFRRELSHEAFRI